MGPPGGHQGHDPGWTPKMMSKMAIFGKKWENPVSDHLETSFCYYFLGVPFSGLGGLDPQNPEKRSFLVDFGVFRCT